jgi:hypothetical protein
VGNQRLGHVAGGKNDILYIHKADSVNEDASYVCYIRAEQESVSALFLQVRAGETKRRNKVAVVGCCERTEDSRRRCSSTGRHCEGCTGLKCGSGPSDEVFCDLEDARRTVCVRRLRERRG